jgi:hypothetical protein
MLVWACITSTQLRVLGIDLADTVINTGGLLVN